MFIGRVEKGISLDDPSRHTKWINHIAPRLWAARKLLKYTGVLIVSIDEHELPRLWMLLEEMYGEKNRLATLIRKRSRKNDASYISEGHEYILAFPIGDFSKCACGLPDDTPSTCFFTLKGL